MHTCVRCESCTLLYRLTETKDRRLDQLATGVKQQQVQVSTLRAQSKTDCCLNSKESECLPSSTEGRPLARATLRAWWIETPAPIASKAGQCLYLDSQIDWSRPLGKDSRRATLPAGVHNRKRGTKASTLTAWLIEEGPLQIIAGGSPCRQKCAIFRPPSL